MTAHPALSLARWAHMRASDLPIATCLQFDATGKPRQIEDPDERERDLRLRRLAVAVLTTHGLHWLPLLDAASAFVAAVPGHLYYIVPAHPSAWNEMPDLAQYMTVMPWREEQEAVH